MAGLNPQKELRYGDWVNVDFTDADLRGYDFTGANLTGARFDGAYIKGAQFDGATVDFRSLVTAKDFAEFTLDRLRESGENLVGRGTTRVNRRIASHRQTTLQSQATVTGIGFHSGAPITLTLGPAPVDAGYVFVRTGLDGGDRELAATAEAVIATEFATVLGDRHGALVSGVEHVLAALRGMDIDNATIELDGPEVPIMDGSVAPFVAAIDQAGVVSQSAERRYIQVLKPVQVAMGDSVAELRPYPHGFMLEIGIDFDHPLIGPQYHALDLNAKVFRREISRARVFGFMSDTARLWSAGFALGASFANTVVFDEDRVLNPEGLRFADEPARRKLVDAIGDLALIGLPLLGAFRSSRGGHKLNHAVLIALLADRTAWRVVEAGASIRQSTEVSRQSAEAVWDVLRAAGRFAF